VGFGPLGNGFSPPGARRRPLLVGGGVGIAPLAILQDALEPTGSRRRPCSGSAMAPGRGAQRCCAAPMSQRTTARSATTACSAPCSARSCSANARCEVYACGPAPMARGRALDLRARGRPGPARARGRMACGFGACFRLRRAAARRRLPARLRRRPSDRRGRARARRRARGRRLDRVLRAGARASRDQRSGTFDAIAARRAFGPALDERFPFAAYVSKTITLTRARGNAPRGCGRRPPA